MLNPSPLRTLSDSAEDVAAADCVDACVAVARGAISHNTERALRSDLGIYVAWCGERGVAAVPARPATVAAFVDEMAKARAPATVRRYVASIAAAHRTVGRGRIVRSAAVRHALQRMHRAKGRRQEQAQGLTWPLRQLLLEACGTALIDLRDRALVAVAYDGMLRRAELSALQVNDLVEEMGGDATLLVRRSKTDQEGLGDLVYLAPDTVGMAKEWLSRAGIAGGRLFRSLPLGRPPGAKLDASQIPRIFKRKCFPIRK
ncbi:MAG: hypothetical protein F4Y41_02725 [Gammaproteobacteria bacterium]|nr:hypothetical protein [Gammaproteobacteria bacterium]MYF27818.1 hypothetical protein [Gammaproteobacteria bacterium]